MKKNPFYLSIQEDDGEIESFGPMSTAKLAFEDVQVEHVADFVVDASLYTWKELGQLIKEQREVMELSRQELADKAGINKQWLAVIERGDEPSKLRTINSVAHALGFRVEGQPIGTGEKKWKRKRDAGAKENPVTDYMRERLHPSDIRRLESLEFKAVFYSDMADLLYSEGLDELAMKYDEEASEALDNLEDVSAEVLESGEPTTGGSEETEAFTLLDPQEFMINAWAQYVFCMRTGRCANGGLELSTRSRLAEYLRMVLKSNCMDFKPTTTDEELLAAAEDAYEAHIEHRLKQITAIRNSEAATYLHESLLD